MADDRQYDRGQLNDPRATSDPSTEEDEAGNADEEFNRQVDVHLARHRVSLPKISEQLHQEREGFQQVLATHWGNAFYHYDACCCTAYLTGNGINDRLSAEASARQDRTFEVLARFQSWALLTASEVRALIFTGHGGGALALSRRALELAILGSFIFMKGGDLAERYARHVDYEKRKVAVEYDKTATALGEERTDPSELKALNERCAELAELYGKNYLSDYGWAAFALKPDRPDHKPTFKEIMQATNLKEVRHFYLHVSQLIHAGAIGSTTHLRTTQQGHAFVTGPSDTGLALPANAALMALVQCTFVFARHELTAYKNHAIPLVQIETLRRLTNEAVASFNKAEDRQAM